MKKIDASVPLPAAFCARIREQFPDEYDSLLQALNEPPLTSVHLHPTKHGGCFFHEEIIPWHSRGRYLKDRPSFTLDPHFHGSAYYPQEASSMVLGWVTLYLFGQRTGLRFLDYCAAPGGKSIVLISHLSESGLLVSNEIVPKRNHVLVQNLTRWGIPRFVCTSSEVSDFAAAGMTFDMVLVDAPCSGEGMFRKDHRARTEWNENALKHCSLRQLEILSDIHQLITPGGYLIYSTCTFAHQENIIPCKSLVASGHFNSVDLPFPESFGIRLIEEGDVSGYSFLPHLTRGEGFFLSVLQRTALGERETSRSRRPASWWEKQSNDAFLLSGLQLPSDIHLARDQRGSVTLGPFDAAQLNSLASHIRITSAGLGMYSGEGRGITPDHGLAMLHELNSDYPSVQLSREDALRYLRGETISGNEYDTCGYVLIRCEEVTLGWAKCVPGRLNNHYPKELRILKR